MVKASNLKRILRKFRKRVKKWKTWCCEFEFCQFQCRSATGCTSCHRTRGVVKPSFGPTHSLRLSGILGQVTLHARCRRKVVLSTATKRFKVYTGSICQRNLQHSSSQAFGEEALPYCSWLPARKDTTKAGRNESENATRRNHDVRCKR